MTPVPLPYRRRLPSVQPETPVAVRPQPDRAVPVTGQPRSAPSLPSPADGAAPDGCGVPPGGTSSPIIPPRWAIALVALVLLLAAVLIGLGHPISIVLEVLAGAGYVGVELVRQLNRELLP